MTMKRSVTWSGLTLTLGELREFVRSAPGDPETVVRVTVEPRYNSPTDPGGTIRLTVSD